MRTLAFAALPLLACTTVIHIGATPVEIADAGDGGAKEGGAPDATTTCVDVPVGNSSRTIQHAGLTRGYEVVRSSTTPACGKLQALFGFHALGSNATAEGQRRELVLERVAPTRALGVFINGSRSAGGRTGWSCAGCDEFEAADDVGLVRAIIGELGIDASRSGERRHRARGDRRPPPRALTNASRDPTRRGRAFTSDGNPANIDNCLKPAGSGPDVAGSCVYATLVKK